MSNRTCQTSSSRLCKWMLPCLFLAWSHVASASDAPEAAQSATVSNLDSEFAQAAEVFKAGDFGKALASFVALSHRTQSPNVQLYIGYCYARLRRPSDAHRAFSLALERIESSRDTQYEATRSAAHQQLLALDPQLSKLTISLVHAPPGAIVKLDGKALDPSQLSSRLTIEPGVHVVEAEAPGAQAIVQSVTLEKGYAKTVALVLPTHKAQEESLSVSNSRTQGGRSEYSSLTTLGWAAAGIGVVGLSVFSFAGLRAKSVYESLQEQCKSPCSDATHRQSADSGRAWQTAANVGLSVGILGTISAATLFVLGSADRNGQRALAGIQLGPRSAQLSYEGRF